MKNNIIDAVGITFALRFVNMAMSIVLTPILFRAMGHEELAGWFILLNNIPLLGLLDFGLIPTLQRRIALTFGRIEAAKNDKRKELLNKRMRQYFSTGRRMFEVRSVITFLFCIIAGYFYLHSLHLTAETKREVYIGWTIVAVGQAIQIRGSIWPSFLITTGHASLEIGSTMIISVVDLLIRILIALSGGGIIALSVVVASSIVARRVWCAYLVRRICPRWVSGGEPFSRRLAGSMASAMLSAWLIGVGGFLIMRTDQYFIVGTMDPKLLPAYQGAYQIYMSLAQFALITGGTASIFLSHYWASGRIEAFRTTIRLSLRIGLAILWFGSATLMAISPGFFDVWLGPGNFLGYGLLAAFSLTMIIESQQNVLTNADRSTEHEVYGRWLLACGVLNIGVTFALSKGLGLISQQMGLIGIALSTSISVLLTTGWVSVRNAHKRLDIHFLRDVLPAQFQAAMMAGCVFGMIKAIQWALGAGRPATADVVLGLAVGPPCLVVWIWFGVFSASQRRGLISYAKGLTGRLVRR